MAVLKNWRCGSRTTLTVALPLISRSASARLVSARRPPTSDDPVVYYLVEDPGDKPVSGVTYDKTIYKIEFKTTKLKEQSTGVLGITYTYYSVNVQSKGH